MNETNWSAEVILKVKGPKEGAVVASIEYQATSREFCVELQNKLAQLGIQLNTKK